jgi:hypothetical protein
MTRKTNSYYAGDDLELPVRPAKPSGGFDRNDPQSLRDHADRMEVWQDANDAFGLQIAAHRRSQQSRRNELQRDLGIENNLTMAQAGVLFNVAWEDGHSDGFYAVINRFEQLVEIIENFNQAGEK